VYGAGAGLTGKEAGGKTALTVVFLAEVLLRVAAFFFVFATFRFATFFLTTFLTAFLRAADLRFADFLPFFGRLAFFLTAMVMPSNDQVIGLTMMIHLSQS
jgi:hypothetical protein